jgi:hypothetical protein
MVERSVDVLAQEAAAARHPLRQDIGWTATDLLFVGAYALVLVAIALATPLQIPELMGIVWSVHYSWPDFLNWISQSTDASPLAYLTQYLFVLWFGGWQLGARLPALLFVIASALLFLQLAKHVVPRRRYSGLLLFVLLPLQLMAFTSSLQFEMGTFFGLCGLLALFALIDRPGFTTGIWLTLATAACLFTDRHSALPIFGAVLFVVRFCFRPQQRKALWFALGSCVWAVAPYVPYYFWSVTHASSHWLTEPKISVTSVPELTIPQYIGVAAIPILVIGIVLAARASFRSSNVRFNRRLTVFCLLGSVLLSIGWMLGSAFYLGSPIAVRDFLFVAPATLLVFLAGVHLTVREASSAKRSLAPIAVAIVALCFAVFDVAHLMEQKSDLALESRYVAPELTGDSCVVFVSEYFSRPLFFLYEPQLESRECDEFFHHRIVLASHPYVRPDQQEGAESVFKGLNFTEVKRVRSGGGQIVVFENKQ